MNHQSDRPEIVENLRIQNQHGSIFFPGATDVSGVDFGQAVRILPLSIEVYPPEHYPSSVYPKVGSKLNREAILTFFMAGSGPVRCRAAASAVDRRANAQGAKLVSFAEDRFSVQVPHFTRYYFGADLEDEEEEEEQADGSATSEEKYIQTGLPVQDPQGLSKHTPNSLVQSVEWNQGRPLAQPDETTFVNVYQGDQLQFSHELKHSKEGEIRRLTSQSFENSVDGSLDNIVVETKKFNQSDSALSYLDGIVSNFKRVSTELKVQTKPQTTSSKSERTQEAQVKKIKQLFTE